MNLHVCSLFSKRTGTPFCFYWKVTVYLYIQLLFYCLGANFELLQIIEIVMSVHLLYKLFLFSMTNLNKMK